MLKGHTDWVRTFQFDSKRVVSGSYDKTIRVWDMKSGACSRVLTGHTDAVNALQYDVEGVALLSGSSDRSLRYWDLRSGTCKRVYNAHEHAINCLSVSQQRVFSGDSSGRLCVWSLDVDDDASGEPLLSLRSHTDSINAICAVPQTIDDDVSESEDAMTRELFARIATASSDGSAKLWRFPLDAKAALAVAQQQRKRGKAPKKSKPGGALVWQRR